jgi:hypothetical protein
VKKPTLKEAIPGFILGLFLLPLTLSLFLERRNFILGAEVHNATIVRVDYEKTRRRKRTFMAYIPTVEIPGNNGVGTKVRVNTYDESPVFKVGEKLEVVFNRSKPNQCLLNTFYEKWFDHSLALLISLLCFLPVMVYLSGYGKRTANFERLQHYKKQIKKR